jgi:xylulokinase
VKQAAARQWVLAFDHGTSGLKTALVSVDGAVGAFEFEAVATRFAEGGAAEQDPEAWWQALVATARRILARDDINPADVVAVAVSSTFSTTVAVGPDGSHLAPALTWMDSRGAPYVRRLVGGFPSVHGYGLTGAARWIARTAGGPSLSGKDDIAHVLWWREQMPQVYAAARAFLPSKDYLNLRLTGRLAASYDSVHLFWLTDIRDPAAIDWDADLVRRVGIDPDKLPPLVGATDILGDLTPAVAAELGLPAPVPVVAGSPDHQSALVGSGAVEDFQAHLYIGTSSWIECLVPTKKTDLLHSIATFPSSFIGRYQMINEQDLAGGALSFLADNVLFDSGHLVPASPVANRYRLLDGLAAEAAAGAGGVLFTPWLNGERTPVDDPGLRGGFHGLSTTTRLPQIVRAVLEGVALNTRWMLGHAERFAGRRFDTLRLVGGGGASPLWAQIFADVLERRIEVAQDPLEANARGAALLASLAIGRCSQAELAAAVRVAAVFEPDASLGALYRGLFDDFLYVHRSTRGLAARRARRRG